MTTTVGASARVSLGEERQVVVGEGCWGGPGGLTAHHSPPAPERCGLRSVDHRLRLFLDVEVFTDAQEEFQCCLKVCASLALPCAPLPVSSTANCLGSHSGARGAAFSLNAGSDSQCGCGPAPWCLHLRSLPFPMGRTLLTSQGVGHTWEPVSAGCLAQPLDL